MTRDEILKLEPGPELDRLVAEKVMEWKEGEDFGVGESGIVRYIREGPKYFERTRIEAWSPSTDIRAAWEVVTKLCKSGITPEVYGLWLTKKKTEWYVVLWYSVEDLTAAARAKASTLPRAICRAALLAVEATQEKEE